MKRTKNTIINFAINHYKLATFIMILFTIATGFFIPKAVIDTDPENMLEVKNPARVFHNKTKQQFELSDIVVIGIINENDPDGVFNPGTLKRIYELTEFSKSLRWSDTDNPESFSGVIEVDMIAPSLVDHMSQAGPGTIRFEWLMPKPPETKQEALEIRDKALSNPLLVGQMISEDGQALCIYLPLTDKLLSYKVYTELRNKIKEFNGDEEYHITGLPVAEGAIGVEMFTQMGTASPLAMAVIFGLLLLFFRKLVLVILPMIIATVSVVSTMGILIGFGYPVHILSSMLPIFLMSISIVDSVHVLSEFFDVYTKEKGRKQTIKEVMNTLFVPVLYTSLTTATGFSSLLLTSIPPARIFGAFLSIGVMIAWLFTVVFVPAYVMLIPEKSLKNFGLSAQEENKQNWLTKILRSVGVLTYKRAKLVIGVLIVLVGIAVWGITQIQVNDNYAKRFTKSHPIRKADIALNNHFGGTYTAYLVLEGKGQEKLAKDDVEQITQELEIFAHKINDEYQNSPQLANSLVQMLPELAKINDSKEAFLDSAISYVEKISANSSDEDFYTWQELNNFLGVEKEKLKIFKRPEVLKYMADLQAHMETAGLIGKSNSVADVVRKVNQELTDGRKENFRIPDKLQSVSECYMQFQQSHRPRDLWHLVTPDYKQANIWMQFKTGDSMDTRAAVKEITSYFKEHKPPVELSYRWAGLHYINLVLENELVWGFLKSFAGSFLVVFVMMTFLFRSPLWGLLCMLPLTITLVAIYGATGIFGKDYDLPIAVLSALSIGMAVDFAIHFLQRSRDTYQKEGSWKHTAPKMFGEPARAISRNVLVIAVGFLPLLTAPLIPYKTTGVMLFAILSFSGVITLFALPAILTAGQKWFFRNVKEKNSNVCINTNIENQNEVFRK